MGDIDTERLFIDGNTLSLEAVGRIARQTEVHARLSDVRLSSRAIENVLASRAIIEKVLKSGQVVYGVNTGFGSLSSVRIDASQLEALQANLIRSHAAGTGDLLDIPTVRAMMLLRANTLAKGLSGVRVEVIETLLAMLKHGVHPCIPSQGSLGASGDLAPLAHLALVLIGEGEAFYQGQRLSGKAAMDKAGIATITLKAKEGLALLNGTQMMSAIGILTLLEAEKLSMLADLAGAMTIEAVKGSHQPFDDRIYQARPHQGHGQSAAQIRAFLANSEIAEGHRDCGKVQDAYSLRCIPQVHGAIRDILSHVRKVLSIEANAATDNPLVFPNGDIISQGNFHGEPVAVALDQLAIGLAELASISERRMDKLMNPVFSELPAFLTPSGKAAGLHSGLMIIHYTAASLVSENKILAHPASVDSVPTSNDKEDHVSMGAIAARKAAKILTHTRWVLTAEVFCASHGLSFEKRLKPGQGVLDTLNFIQSFIPPVTGDRVFAKDIETLSEKLDSQAFEDILTAYRA
ncbi:MAG: histidine ammonia-lyase [Vampirovibrionales bacterium]|nr:histidine ammonia-lyase [Vampirovibrionales bacterium]